MCRIIKFYSIVVITDSGKSYGWSGVYADEFCVCKTLNLLGYCRF